MLLRLLLRGLLGLLGVLLIHEISIVCCRIRRQHATHVILLLTTIDGLWKCGGSGRIHAGIGSIKVVLIVKLKVQTQSIGVVVHDGGLYGWAEKDVG